MLVYLLCFLLQARSAAEPAVTDVLDTYLSAYASTYVTHTTSHTNFCSFSQAINVIPSIRYICLNNISSNSTSLTCKCPYENFNKPQVPKTHFSEMLQTS